MQEEIAQLSESHLDATTAFIADVRRYELPDLNHSTGDRPDWVEPYRTGSGNFWITVADGNVVGTVGLVDLGGGQGCLQRMYVHPNHRGTRTALRLLNTLIDWANSRRMRDIYLGTFSKQRAAQRFYEKHGFRRISHDNVPTDLPRSDIEDRFYVLSLDSSKRNAD